MDSDADILLLLDCCYAAQAARARERRQGKFEILAAAAMGMKTPKPGAKSFTNTLIREMKQAVENDGFVVIKDLHGPLCDRRRGLFATPVHITIKAGHRPLRLEPIVASSKEQADVVRAASILHLVVSIKDGLTRDSAGKVSEWLGTDIPHVVSGLKVLEDTEHIECVVQEVDKRQNGYAEKLDLSARTEVLEAWEKIVTLVRTFRRSEEAEELSGGNKKARIRDFLKQLDTDSSQVLDTLERHILTCDDLEDSSMLQEAANNNHIQALGMDSQLHIRSIILAAQEAHLVYGDTRLDERTGVESGLVLREYKIYGDYVDPKEMPALEHRVKLLAHLLATSKSDGFRSLRCLGWSHQEFERRYTFDFEVPNTYGRPDMISLHLVIKTIKGRDRPTLNERFTISHLMAKAIQKWHLVGWVHQGISSHNIIFFLHNVTQRPDYMHPFLHGFEFARPDSAPSLGSVMEDFEFNLYRHPDRQGTARKGHKKRHDVYSLGVVLLEIGIWQCAIEMVKTSKHQPTPREIRSQLRRNCTERLPHIAGTSFQSAVDVCLSSEFGVKMDDEKGSQTAKEFQIRVVDRIGEGVTAC